MTKFNVGDQIRILNGEKLAGNGNYSVTTGKEYEVISFHEKSELEVEHIKVAGNFSNSFIICDWEYKYIELVNSKPTKNQRITTLENEVAELKLIVHELRGKKSIEPSTTNTVEDIIEFEGMQYRKVDREARESDVIIIRDPAKDNLYARINVPHKVVLDALNKLCVNNPEDAYVYCDYFGRTHKTVDVYERIVNLEKSPNQQRAAIIEKAEKFVWDNLKGQHYTFPCCVISFSNTQGFIARHDIEFIVNTDKRTIVALILDGDYNNRVCQRGIAKCNPSDVFNEHIGKAIALGRALGLDVSEFEQAVQPTEFVSEQIITFESDLAGEEKGTKLKIMSIEDSTLWFDDGFDGYDLCDEDWKPKIVNDTNANYKEG